MSVQGYKNYENARIEAQSIGKEISALLTGCGRYGPDSWNKCR